MFSSQILHSLKSSFFYFRFGIFALAIPLIIHTNSKILIYLFIFSLLTFFIISFDGIYEYVNGSNLFHNKAFPGRIAGLFGDEWVIGSFLSRVMPVVFFLYFINLKNLNKFVNFFFIITIIISFITIILSGERAAYLYGLILLFFFIILFIKNKIFKLNLKALLLSFIFIFVASLPFTLSKTTDRLFNNINVHTSLDPSVNYYLGYYNTAYEMFLDEPLLGHGPKTFRIICDDYKKYDNSCNTHPHNTYFQLLSEAGILSFTFIFLLFIYISSNIIKILFKKNITSYDSCRYSLLISMFINTFPLVPTGSFFNNWTSVIYYIPIGFYLYLLVNKKYMLEKNIL